MKTWSPRYIAYATSNGKTPEDMLATDKKEFPSACMMEFILWIGRKWNEWCGITGNRVDFKTQEMHDDFDAWLKEKS